MDVEHVERELDKLSLTKREKCLLDLSFDRGVTDQAFQTLIDDLDLDAENQNFLLMLSSLGFLKGWEQFPPEMVPRLKGLHRYHQARISIGVPWLVEQIRKLAGDGIPVMLLKGIAVKTYYAPNRPRLMHDYDFAVPLEHFDRALELLLRNENILGQRSPHSVVVQGPRDSVDMHRWIFKMHNEQFSDIWERAETFQLHGVEVSVPSQEDMFLHLLDTQSRNYFRTESPTNRLQWIYDCFDIWNYSSRMSMGHLSLRAKQLHITSRVRMILRILVQCFPDLFDVEEFEHFFPRTQEYDQLLVRGQKHKIAFEKYCSYGYDKESAMTPLHIIRGLRFEMIRYRYMKPELHLVGSHMNYFRFIKMAYCLDGFSDLVKNYLSRFRLFGKRKKALQ